MSQLPFNFNDLTPENAPDDSAVRNAVQSINRGSGARVTNPDVKQAVMNGTLMSYITEPHVPCCLLVDTSGSMGINGRIEELNTALRAFKETVCQDTLSQRRVDVCVISFDSTVNVVTPFGPIVEFEPPTLRAYGGTSMGAGIRFALEAVHEQVQNYQATGVDCYPPRILMITDGEPTDDIEGIDHLISARENQGRYGHLRFWAFGVKGANIQVLKKLTQRVFAVSNNAFDEIFNWASKSMQIISHSQPGQKVISPDPTPNMNPIISDKHIPRVWDD